MSHGCIPVFPHNIRGACLTAQIQQQYMEAVGLLLSSVSVSVGVSVSVSSNASCRGLGDRPL